MKPVRASTFAGAVPVGAGHRTPQTQLLRDERDKLLIEAAKCFPGSSDREIARRLHTALLNYRNGRWQRDRAEALCPLQHRGKLLQIMWMILKVRDHVPSEMTIRRALGDVATSSRGGSFPPRRGVFVIQAT